MQPTLDAVPGNWTLWLRTKVQPQTAVYQATFTATGPGSSKGEVTLTSTGATYSGTWEEKDGFTDEQVNFQITGIPGVDDGLSFRGYLVGQAMGGNIAHFVGPVPLPPYAGAWSAYKISD